MADNSSHTGKNSAGFAHLNDEEFITAFENCAFDPSDFHHADHVRLARVYILRDGVAQAEAKMLAGIRNLAIHAGAPQKFLYTTTVAWVRLVAAHCRNNSDQQTFEAWIAQHSELLDTKLLDQYYSPGTLKTDTARNGWVDANRKVLP